MDMKKELKKIIKENKSTFLELNELDYYINEKRRKRYDKTIREELKKISKILNKHNAVFFKFRLFPKKFHNDFDVLTAKKESEALIKEFKKIGYAKKMEAKNHIVLVNDNRELIKELEIHFGSLFFQDICFLDEKEVEGMLNRKISLIFHGVKIPYLDLKDELLIHLYHSLFEAKFNKNINGGYYTTLGEILYLNYLLKETNRRLPKGFMLQEKDLSDYVTKSKRYPIVLNEFEVYRKIYKYAKMNKVPVIAQLIKNLLKMRYWSIKKWSLKYL